MSHPPILTPSPLLSPPTASLPLHVLVIEDHRDLAESLRTLLSAEGYRVDVAQDGRAGLAQALAEPPDVLILDLMLPSMDGLEVCAKLRAQCDRHVPVLMLTARDTLPDKLEGFSAGADDYLVKPFVNEELLVRCLALSRRAHAGTAHVLQIGSLTIDRRTGEIRRENQPLRLRETSRRILFILAHAWPRPVSRSELIRRLWRDDPPESDPLRSHLYLLRQVLDKPFAVPILTTVHDVGFVLRADQ